MASQTGDVAGKDEGPTQRHYQLEAIATQKFGRGDSRKVRVVAGDALHLVTIQGEGWLNTGGAVADYGIATVHDGGRTQFTVRTSGPAKGRVIVEGNGMIV